MQPRGRRAWSGRGNSRDPREASRGGFPRGNNAGIPPPSLFHGAPPFGAAAAFAPPPAFLPGPPDAAAFGAVMPVWPPGIDVNLLQQVAAIVQDPAALSALSPEQAALALTAASTLGMLPPTAAAPPLPPPSLLPGLPFDAQSLAAAQQLLMAGSPVIPPGAHVNTAGLAAAAASLAPPPVVTSTATSAPLTVPRPTMDPEFSPEPPRKKMKENKEERKPHEKILLEHQEQRRLQDARRSMLAQAHATRWARYVEVEGRHNNPFVPALPSLDTLKTVEQVAALQT